ARLEILQMKAMQNDLRKGHLLVDTLGVHVGDPRVDVPSALVTLHALDEIIASPGIQRLSVHSGNPVILLCIEPDAGNAVLEVRRGVVVEEVFASKANMIVSRHDSRAGERVSVAFASKKDSQRLIREWLRLSRRVWSDSSHGMSPILI